MQKKPEKQVKKPKLFFKKKKNPKLIAPNNEEYSKNSHHVDLSTGKVYVYRKNSDKTGSDNLLDKKQDSAKQSSRQETKKQEIQEEHKEHAIVNRVHTGIPGLDEVMGGGLRPNTVNLLGGGAGSGKSIFCMQYLIEGIKKHNENGIYISFEESVEKIKDDMASLGWDLSKLEKEKKLVILYYSPEQIQKVLDSGGGIVRDVIEVIKAKRLVIDSLTAFTLLYENDIQKRKSVLHLFDAIYKWNVTAVLTGEHESDIDKHRSNIMEFEVDSVLLLYNLRKGDIRERSLEVFKMRGSKHANKIFPMKIDDNGICIFPDETVF